MAVCAVTRNDTWRVATKPYSGAHFAAFPEELVRPMILAGTSAKGVCPACGAPWVRVVEKRRLSRPELPKEHPGYRPNVYNGSYTDINGRGDAGYSVSTTTGWRPTCTCNAGESIPATVMDPFNGSGTSGRVATKLGRSYIGIDVCEEYLESLSPGRIYDTQIEMSF